MAHPLQQSGKRLATEHEKGWNDAHFATCRQPAHFWEHVLMPHTCRSLHDTRLAHLEQADLASAGSAGLDILFLRISRLTEVWSMPRAAATSEALARPASMLASTARLEALNCLPLFFPI